ncbi:3-dehydroquinate synthase [Anaerosolibacter carboniphilus]|uniref:3-dehydroquinate synthase n=1 Tax=Anaerosolibacter carboniphilus TaxID=1417629 RepID=A0A841KXJ9_9FIRM|nr:3-dehydroquinate synthase [Anaerosolibacter carboniphilus]MBB6218077.1 3-dehydroquinate synthase [Anaerosolibacter carboniphilus]
MEKLQIDLGEKSYPIYIGSGLLERLEDYIDTADQWVVITDENLESLYEAWLKQTLKNKTVYKIVIVPGEESKNIHTVVEIIDYLHEIGCTRQSKILAFGGGVVGDIAGFCASIYMRGIEYIQMPTTLLAQVDSSVGGKTGINIAQGKNIMGTFYQPQAVIIDVNLLRTLSKRDFMSGLGEVVKYGVIYDYDFFQYIRSHRDEIFSLDQACIGYIIKRCCEIKAGIVSQDEKEKGMRKILNFGHTIGHALESITAYEKYTHGEAVWVGMYHEILLAERLGLIKHDYFEELLDFFQAMGVSYDISAYDKEGLIDMMSKDKKNLHGKISFILPIDRSKVVEKLLSREELQW